MLKSKKQDGKNDFVYFIFFCLFLYSSGNIIYSLYVNNQLSKIGVKTTGVVEDINVVSARYSSYYYPVVKFEGKAREARRSCSRTAYKRGQTIPIVYAKNNPSMFIIDNGSYRYGFLFNSFAIPFYAGILYGLYLIASAFNPSSGEPSKYDKAINRTR